MSVDPWILIGPFLLFKSILEICRPYSFFFTLVKSKYAKKSIYVGNLPYATNWVSAFHPALSIFSATSGQQKLFVNTTLT